jgi:hypothetical protein
MSKAQLDRVGVVPFLKGRHPTNIGETLDCNLCNLVFNPKNVVPGAERTLTKYAHESMAARFGDRVILQSEISKVYHDLPIDEAKDTPLSIAKKIGESLGANLMILGTVWRYRERIGGPAGSTNPASVAFDLYLIDVSTGNLLWTGNFDETQRSLSENVLDVGAFFKRGGKWLTANELARFGMKEVVSNLSLS